MSTSELIPNPGNGSSSAILQSHYRILERSFRPSLI
jgi:hypothetical protein